LRAAISSTGPVDPAAGTNEDRWATGIAVGTTPQKTEFTQSAWSAVPSAVKLRTDAVDAVDAIDCSQVLAARAQGQANGRPSGMSWPQRARSAISLSDVVGIG
jgi:hypothetical protein